MFKFLKCYILFYLRFLQLFVTIVQAAEYVLLPDNDEVAAPCDSPDDESFSKIFDLSDMGFSYNGDTVEVKGSLKFLWHSGPNENFELSVNTYKKQGSDFVPTFLNLKRRDGCKALFDPSEVWYTAMVANIPKEDRICITHQDEVVWHWKPFNVSLKLEIDGPNAEGTYKVVVKGKSYGKRGQPTGNEFCFQMLSQLYME